MTDRATAYAKAVISGEILACKWVILACERHVRDLKDPRFIFDVKESERRIEMCSTMYHYKGPAKGTQFKAEPWQQFILGCLFGWKVRETGLRRFSYAFIKVPRKNGKTFMAAAVALQMLIAGGQLQRDGTFAKEGGAEVYFVATKEDQAKIGWNDCVKIIKRSPGYSDILKPRVKEIRYEAQDGICRPLGSDSDSLDGLNPFCSIKDELHAWKDRVLWDVIDDAFGARDQPLDFVITTEGTVRNGIHDEVDQHARNILTSDGTYTDEKFFAIIFSPDEGDDPFDEKSWKKANPCLGVHGAKSINYMRDKAARARLVPGQLSTFLTKQLNVRVDAEKAWLSLDQWDACKGAVDMEAIRGVPGFGGLDLARVNDWSSASLCFPAADGTIDVIWKYWIPEAQFEQLARDGRVPVRVWEKAGLLSIAGDNVTDFSVIEHDLLEWSKLYQIEEIGYDPMFATDLANRLAAEGVKMTEVRQTFTNYTPPCTELERLLEGARMRHGGHAIARWNAGNAIVREGPSGNKMPDKVKSKAKIDGISAMLMGLRPIALRPADFSGDLIARI